jgi:heterotetrameric sarcosine oxidase gamma subunit
VSARDPGPPPAHPPGITLAACAAGIIELAAFRGRSSDLEQLAARRGVGLAALGRIAVASGQLTLSVRPGRWLLLAPPASTDAAAWADVTAGRGAIVDHSSGLAGFVLAGSAVREMLVRACRLDLAADAFPEGRAAATIMVQVPVILAALPGAMLLLTPATTARHLREWLVTASRPFGLALAGEVGVAELCGDGSK